MIVSGGGRGLGAAIVLDLLQAGHTVCTFSRTETPPLLKQLATQPDLAERCFYQSVDMADEPGLKAFVADCVKKYGRIDALINNAGIARESVIALSNPGDMQTIFNTNFFGAANLTRHCVRNMLLNRRGAIINISSIIGIRGYSGLSLYAASKGALDAFTRSLARELGTAGIRVNGIAPGYLETDMSDTLSDSQRRQITRRTPMGRLGRAEDVAPAVRFLLDPATAFMTGQTLVIDGGLTV
ncbi:MAG: SDR family oxidoreductase [Betaproteobacteria bacterium]|nr:SDR family oxidoreductase [Betaproteobacteria bacterium]